MKAIKKLKSKLYRICIYLRVSTEEQAENPEGSIKNQEQRLREFVRLKNSVESFGEVVAVFTDPGVSAKNMNRPGFQKMLHAIGQGEVDMVLVTELSRFSRSTKDFTMLQEYLEEHGCKFMSLRENFDTSGAAGSMVLNMMASIAEFERRQTAERVSHSFLARSKRGLYNGGSVILGYKIDENRPGYLLVDPDMAEVVKFAFQSFLKQETLAATTKFLNGQKLRLPRKIEGGGNIRESKFTIDSLYRLLRNKAYIGVKVYTTKNGEEETSAVWEPLIDKETFDRVNRLLKKNRHHKRTHAGQRYPYTLSGLVFCEHCEGRMSGKSAHGSDRKVGYYEHLKHTRLQASVYERLPIHEPHRIPAVKIEPLVWQEVKRFIQSDAFAKDLWERARLRQETLNQVDEVSKLKKRIALTVNQIEVLAERIASIPKSVDPAPLLGQLERLQRAKVEQERVLIETERSKPLRDEPVQLESLMIFRKDLKRLIEKGELDKSIQTAIIHKVVHKITIQPNGFEIHFHIGNSHYMRELGKTPGSRLFAFQGREGEISRSKLQVSRSTLLTNGDPGRIRTCDLLLRRQLLYPTELPDHGLLLSRIIRIWKASLQVLRGEDVFFRPND